MQRNNTAESGQMVAMVITMMLFMFTRFYILLVVNCRVVFCSWVRIIMTSSLIPSLSFLVGSKKVEPVCVSIG